MSFIINFLSRSFTQIVLKLQTLKAIRSFAKIWKISGYKSFQREICKNKIKVKYFILVIIKPLGIFTKRSLLSDLLVLKLNNGPPANNEIQAVIFRDRFIFLETHGKFQPWFSTKIVEKLVPCPEISRLWRSFAISQNLFVNFKYFP